jgi:hypothetical protein
LTRDERQFESPRDATRAGLEFVRKWIDADKARVFTTGITGSEGVVETIRTKQPARFISTKLSPTVQSEPTALKFLSIHFIA